jgi:hypothetical protein
MGRRLIIGIGLLVIALCVVAAAAIVARPVRMRLRSLVPASLMASVDGWRHGYRADSDVRISMRDGVVLAASLYTPREVSGKLATVFVRHPYNRFDYFEGLQAINFFVTRGYAVLIEDIRGKYESGGEFIPYQHGTTDGVDTLEWIVHQPWSNGRVGTFGCSALGELQFVLARARHPAHAAMIAIGAGGAVGSAAGRYSYFGLFEGGVFQLASGFGWFHRHGARDPHAPGVGEIDIKRTLQELPIVDLVHRVRPSANGYDAFLRTPLSDPYWDSLDYLSESDRLTTPALVINTWGDQTVGDTLALAESIRRSTPDATRTQRTIIAPGGHCGHDAWDADGRFGDIEIRGAKQPYFDYYTRWFDYWLRDSGPGLADLPPYLYYMLGEQRWLTATAWPPPDARIERWYLASGGHANGRDGNGVLASTAQAGAPFDEFTYDPSHPVPSRGGPVCCTGDPADRDGPVDQAEVEQRSDVLVYTSAPLDQALRVAGPLRAHLVISSSARDTDFIARLVHVWPDGRATNIQEGALRARYRNGFKTPVLLEPGTVTELTVDLRSIAYTIPRGHRLRLQVTSSSFPRLERNLNTGGRNFDESKGVVAINRVYHAREGQSFIELPLLPSVAGGDTQ